jgi:hypothetical protein
MKHSDKLTTRDRVMAVECPRCGAMPRTACMTRRGARAQSHIERHAVALRGGAPSLYKLYHRP